MTAEHVPTDHSKQLVALHAAVGTPQEAMSEILGMDKKTLRKHYRYELDTGLASANAVVGGTLFNKAKAGDVASMIFWLKTRARWRETNNVNLTSEDGSMTPPAIDYSKLSTEAMREILAARNENENT